MRRIRFVALALIGFVATLIGSFLSPGTFLHRILSVATCTVFSFNSTLCAANLARSGDRVVAANPPAVVAQGNACGSETVTQPTMQQGHDGTMYQVYYDFRRGRETVNSAACGREYWISPNSEHRLYGIRFVYLVNGQRNRVVPNLYYETASGDVKVYDNNVAAARLPNPFSPDLGIASNPNPTLPQVDRRNSSQPTQQQARPEFNKPNRTGGSTSNVPCNPTLQSTSAQPAKEVIIKGVPTSFTELEVTFKPAGTDKVVNTAARRLDQDAVAVVVPLHPAALAAGGDVQLTLSSGRVACPVVSLRIEPLPNAPGTARQVLTTLQSSVDRLSQKYGASRSLLQGDLKSLPPELQAPALSQLFLDHPANPNSLTAIFSGTAPILKGKTLDLQLLDGLLVSSGFLDAINAYLTKLTTSENLTIATRAKTIEKETMKQTYSRLAAESSTLILAKQIPPEKKECKNINTAEELDSAMREYVRAKTESENILNKAVQSYFNLLVTATVGLVGGAGAADIEPVTKGILFVMIFSLVSAFLVPQILYK